MNQASPELTPEQLDVPSNFCKCGGLPYYYTDGMTGIPRESCPCGYEGPVRAASPVITKGNSYRFIDPAQLRRNERMRKARVRRYEESNKARHRRARQERLERERARILARSA